MELLGTLQGGLTLEVDRDLNLGQFGLIWPTIWQMGTNSDFSFILGGVLDIGLETLTLTSECLPFYPSKISLQLFHYSF